MLTNEEIKKIEDFVYTKPRSIQEIADYIKKNWRTADRYIQDIEKNFGTITTRVFREGTRGALKIVYWASVEKISSSIFQKLLEEDIFKAKRKEEFSAFDIFQHIPDKNKNAKIEKSESENLTDLEEFSQKLQQAKKQVLLFSGNISFINLKNKQTDIFKVIDSIVKKGISIKVISRVDIEGKENIKKLLSLNYKYGKEMIEVHHREQPLRATIVDNKCFRMKEIKEPTGKSRELDKKLFIFYNIQDKDWTEWISRIFWKMFSQAVDANKRLEEINKLKV